VSTSGDPSRDGEPEIRTATDWLRDVTDAERRGELLSAFDLAERGLAQHPSDVSLKHRAVLALARSGSTEEARRRFQEYGLGGIATEDVAALRARIVKDVALAATGAERRRHAARSAALYEEIFGRTRGFYPAINAATLTMIAGDTSKARELGAQVLDLLRDDGDDYYAAATRAEAHLLLGRIDDARDALDRAAALRGDDEGAVSTTRRQLRLVCDTTGIGRDILAPLAGPTVVHYCGHLVSAADRGGRFPAAAEPMVARRIAEEVARLAPAYAYGALANGGDILWAEELLARGAELHVVLPFAQSEFVQTSVATSGGRWVERFDRCIAAASSVTYATEDAFLGDDVLFRYGAELAMGLALLRARYLDSEPRQLALWDGGEARGSAGTAIEVRTWRRLGLPVTVVDPAASRAGRSPADETRRTTSKGRVVRALLFADIKGFARLNDEQLPRFADRVLGAFASVLEEQGPAVCARNTWGDAMYVVLSDAVAGAACALELQHAMSSVDLEAEALPSHLALRLGGHVGPVFHIADPVTQAQSFMGSHVSRTARIEPVTPPGSVYVTEPFAAALVLAGRDDFVSDYVGHMPAAKDFGRLRMYSLRRR
jgi:tetratricopeptide (TPR) repeat protein